MADRKYETLQRMMIASLLGEAVIRSEMNLAPVSQQALVKVLVDAMDLGIALVAAMDGMDDEEIALRGDAAREKLAALLSEVAPDAEMEA